MATNFLEATNNSTIGYFSAVTTVISSEIVSLGSSLTATSGSIFTSSGNFGQSIWAEAYVKWGGAITPVAGGYLAGWFLRSPDGGTTFETATSSALSMARQADFVIPLSTIAYAANNVCYASGLIKMPWSPVKIFLQNGAGATLPASTTQYTVVALGPVAVQY